MKNDLSEEFATAARELHAVQFKAFDSQKYMEAMSRYALADYNMHRWREQNGRPMIEEV